MPTPMWAVYDHPKDDPKHYVARLWLDKPTDSTMRRKNLAELRDILRNNGLVSIERHWTDDPVIVGVWI